MLEPMNLRTLDELAIPSEILYHLASWSCTTGREFIIRKVLARLLAIELGVKVYICNCKKDVPYRWYTFVGVVQTSAE